MTTPTTPTADPDTGGARPASSSRRATRRAMRLSVLDAACYALMVGLGEAYFIADAVRLRADALAIGLLATLPLAIGALGPLLSLTALGRLRRRKPIVVVGAAVQAGILASLAAGTAADAITPATLIALACGYQAGGQAAGAAWASWYGDLVPARIRGRWFSRRSRIAHAATCASVIAAGAVLQIVEPGAAGAVAAGAGGHGYVAIFAAAAVCRALSCVLLALSPEPAAGELTGVRRSLAHLSSPAGSRLRRLIAAACALQLFVYLGSPYFAPYMLEELRLSYLEYTAATVMVVLVKSVMLPAWGGAVDRHGARAVYLLALVLVGVVPLPWLVAGGVGVVLAAQAMSGFAWGAHEVAQFSLLLESAEARLRPALFAAVNAANGIAQLAGGLIGGLLLAVTGRGFLIVFAASLLGRLIVAALAPAVIARADRAGPGRPPIGRRQLLLRVVGIHPSGGLVHRPIPGVDDEPPEVAAADGSRPGVAESDPAASESR